MKTSLLAVVFTFVSSLAAPILNPRLAARGCLDSLCERVFLPIGASPPAEPLPDRKLTFRLEKRLGMGGGKVPRSGGRRQNREKPLLDIKQDKFGDRRETKLSRGVIGLVNFFGNSKVQQGIKDAFKKVKEAFINWGKDEKATRKALREKKFNRGGKQ